VLDWAVLAPIRRPRSFCVSAMATEAALRIADDLLVAYKASRQPASLVARLLLDFAAQGLVSFALPPTTCVRHLLSSGGSASVYLVTLVDPPPGVPSQLVLKHRPQPRAGYDLSLLGELVDVPAQLAEYRGPLGSAVLMSYVEPAASAPQPSTSSAAPASSPLPDRAMCTDTLHALAKLHAPYMRRPETFRSATLL